MLREQLSTGNIGDSATATRSALPTRAIATILLFWLLLACGELTIQALYYWQNRQGLFAVIQGKERYQFLPDGLKLLNPRASRPDFRINSLGLRDDEVVMPKPKDQRRIAIVGGSSVMGEKAKTNEARFSDIMGRDLKEKYADRIDVLNVGVAGAQAHDLGALISYITPRATPDVIVLYPGGNDISQVCVPAPSAQRIRAPQPSLPGWWLSTAMLRDKTAKLRPVAPQGKQATPSSLHLDVADYVRRLTAVVDLAKADGRKVYLMTNARAFGRDQSPDMMARMSASFRSFASCFTPGALSDEFDTLNDQIRVVARQTGVALVDTGRLIPHDEKLFADSVHFSEQGERDVAGILEKALSDQLSDLKRP